MALGVAFALGFSGGGGGVASIVSNSDTMSDMYSVGARSVEGGVSVDGGGAGGASVAGISVVESFLFYGCGFFDGFVERLENVDESAGTGKLGVGIEAGARINRQIREAVRGQFRHELEQGIVTPDLERRRGNQCGELLRDA